LLGLKKQLFLKTSNAIVYRNIPSFFSSANYLFFKVSHIQKNFIITLPERTGLVGLNQKILNLTSEAKNSLTTIESNSKVESDFVYE